MWKICPVLSIAMLVVGCGSAPTAKEFSPMVDQFIYPTLALSPVSATAAGYHQHEGVSLDEQLDDVSEAGLNKQREFFRTFQGRLEKEFDRERLAPQDRADYEILRD